MVRIEVHRRPWYDGRMASVTMSIDSTSDDEIEDFLESSGDLQSIMLDCLTVGLRRKLTAEGAMPFIRRDECLRFRVLLARRWEASSVETIKAKLISAILSINSIARIKGVELRKRGRYIEGEIGIIRTKEKT